MTRVTLYGKPGCHLCDEARAVVAEVRRERPFELIEVDITFDPGINRRYTERIPVLELNGEVISELTLDQTSVRAWLDTVGADD
jgi:glutaredoxin